MTQYISTKTKNLLELHQCQFNFLDRTFPGLIDPYTGELFDHPEDSFYKHISMKSSQELGLIVPIEGERVDWSSKIKYIVPSMVKDNKVLY